MTPNKTTTKIHIAYDASPKVGSSMNSLNEHLNHGSLIIPDPYGLIIRFRMHPIVILTSNELAFLQVVI